MTEWETHNSFCIIVFFFADFWVVICTFLYILPSILISPLHLIMWEVNTSLKGSIFVKKRKESEGAPPYLRNTRGSLSGFWCFIFRGNIWIQTNRGTQVYLATVCAEFNQSQAISAPSPSSFSPLLFLLISLQSTVLYWHEWQMSSIATASHNKRVFFDHLYLCILLIHYKLT